MGVGLGRWVRFVGLAVLGLSDGCSQVATWSVDYVEVSLPRPFPGGLELVIGQGWGLGEAEFGFGVKEMELVGIQPDLATRVGLCG